MTNAIVIKSSNRTIELTKKFANAAKNYGTVEYRELQEVRKDYPNYKIVTRTVSKKADSYKGLTLDYMEKYLQKRENKDLLVAFYAKCGKDENGKKVELATSEPYGKIKKWFLENNAEIADFNAKKDEILKKVS